MRSIRLLAVAILGVLLALSGAQNASAQLILDQKQEVDGSGVTLGSGDHDGQEFTPALTPLAAVAIFVDLFNGPCTLEASIRQGTTGHDLSGTVLGSPVSKAVSVAGWVEFDFSPISVTPGQRYAIQIIVTSGPGSGPVWYFAGSDVYLGGQSITYGAYQPSDMMFRTYSGPPQISLSPIFGLSGTMVTVTGSGFTVSAQPYCDFTSSPSGLVGPIRNTDFVCNIASDGSIVTAWFVVAAGASGSYSVTVSYFGQASALVQFTVSQPQRPSVPVGGVVAPVNTFVILGPWLAVIGVVGCIGTVVAVAKPWKKREG
jgi:hypothetical protein